jgi:hypothetical protein
MRVSRRFPPLLLSLLLAAAALTLPVNSSGQVRVTHITSKDGTAGRKGVIYALPRTVLAIDLQITRTDRMPGPFAQFAQELLGVSDVITAQEIGYSVDKAFIITQSEADPEQVYLVEKDEKASEDIFYAFSDCGLMIGSESIPEVQGMNAVEWQDYFSKTFSTGEIFPGYKAGAMKENTDTITRIVSFDTLTYTEKILKRHMVKQSDREKALEAASMINSIGQDKYTLMVGYQETAYSVEALKFMTEQLEEQRIAYLQLFTGVTRNEQVHIRLSYIPPTANMEEIALTGFSPLIGLTAPDGSNDITVTLVKKGLTDVMGNDPAPTGNTLGYAYRIPESCVVVVRYKGEVIGSNTLYVNQAGIVRSLPPAVTHVEFYPETGSLKKVILK